MIIDSGSVADNSCGTVSSNRSKSTASNFYIDTLGS